MLGLGLMINKTIGLVSSLISVWILNTDVSQVGGYKYIWTDSENWSDTNNWKD